MTPSPETLTAAANELDANARLFEKLAKLHRREATLAKGAYGDKHTETADDLMGWASNAARLATAIRPTN